MSKVVDIGGFTTLDIDPNKVLSGAIDKLEQVFVVGWENDKLYIASSTSKTGELLTLLELAKLDLLRRFDG